MIVVWILGVGAVIVLVALLALRSSMRTRATLGRRLFTFAAMIAIPGLWLLGMFAYADVSMRRTSFCLSCHEMQPYGASLTAEGEESLAAAHYTEGRSDRDKACYGCHTKPGLSGYIDAKLRGLHDVRVHYLGDIPETLHIRGGYNVSVCLDCHGETEDFGDHPAHQAVMSDMGSGGATCLDCHGPAHVVAGEDGSTTERAGGSLGARPAESAEGSSRADHEGAAE